MKKYSRLSSAAVGIGTLRVNCVVALRMLMHCTRWTTYAVKRIRRFYGKIPGIWLPVHLPLFLRASTGTIFLELKIW